jgi:predicted PurR-regulated permease PerM
MGSEQSFTKKVLITVSVVLLAVLLIAAVFYVFDVILLLFAAVLLATFLRGLADLLNRYTKLSEGASVLLVSFLLIVIVAGAIFLLAPSVTEQAKHLRVELPKSAKATAENISRFNWGKALIDQLPSSEDVLNRIDIPAMMSRVGGFFSSTMGAIGNFFVVLLLAVYLASEPKFYVSGLIKLFPVPVRARALEVLGAMGDTLRWWLIGKVISMVFIGLVTWIGLSLLGVPLALTLGLLAGLLSFVPNFGPILSAIPALLLAFIASPIKSVYVLILFIVVQIIESNLVTPFIERRTVELPPALTVVAQIALGILIGGLGLVLATPMLALIMVLVHKVYIEDVLGDDEPQTPKSRAQRRGRRGKAARELSS